MYWDGGGQSRVRVEWEGCRGVPFVYTGATASLTRLNRRFFLCTIFLLASLFLQFFHTVRPLHINHFTYILGTEIWIALSLKERVGLLPSGQGDRGKEKGSRGKNWRRQQSEGERSWLLVFWGISTLVGYLMPNPLYMIC